MSTDQRASPSPSLQPCTPAEDAVTSSLTLTPLPPSEIATAASSDDEIQLAQDSSLPVATSSDIAESHVNSGSAGLMATSPRLPVTATRPGESESEEPDDSNDEDWSEAESAAENELETADSAESDADEQIEQDISINLMEVDVNQKVANLIRSDTCERRCLQGNAQALEYLVCSILQMTKSERRLASTVLMQTDTVERRRGKREREKFNFYLPFVGSVCRPSFARCLGVTPMTIQRYKTRVRDGNIAAKAHGNTLNKNAASIDIPREDYTLLPAYFTWDTVYDEMHTYVQQIRLRVSEPARSTMRKLLTQHCSHIRIRSVRSNVCDVCAIYQSRMRSGPTVEETEDMGVHTMAAREMRKEYKKDKTAVAYPNHVTDTAIIVMDFSQNLTVPSVSSTPPQLYFCSLVAVNVFGIFYENEKTQTNFVYDETVSRKGSDQINAMLHHFIDNVVPGGKKKLIVYADNCGGQNKNKLVIKFLLAQVQMRVLESADYDFFVKGHTKNSCDRGFGHIRKYVARQGCWTLKHVVTAVRDSAVSNRTVHISRGDGFFKGYKPIVNELYKNLTGVQQFQWFRMDTAKPGVVECKKSPSSSDLEEQYLRRKVDGIFTESSKVTRMFERFLEPLSVPVLNPEKRYTMHHMVRPYVPEEFQSDAMYHAPTQQQGDAAKAAKQSRRLHRAAMAAAAKSNQSKRGKDDEEEKEEGAETKKKPRKSV